MANKYDDVNHIINDLKKIKQDIHQFAGTKTANELERIITLLIERDQELAHSRQEQEEQIRELDNTTKMLVRRDLELTTTNERLSELDHVKSDFVSVVAHQLRTPLSAIKWTLNMFLVGDMGSLAENQTHYLQNAYDDNERMITLINDLLNLEYLETGGRLLKLRPVQLETLVDSALHYFVGAAKKKNIKITVVKPEQLLPKVKADQDKIELVLQNIIDNAIKYSPIDSTITIRFELLDTGIMVSIDDQGIGIPLAERTNIFSRFYRASNALRVDSTGSGLGLYIAKSIIDLHEGHIWFHCHKDAGTTFQFLLPIVLG